MLDRPDVGSTTRVDGASDGAIGSDVTGSSRAVNNPVPPVQELFPFPWMISSWRRLIRSTRGTRWW